MTRQILFWILLAYSSLAYAGRGADTVSSTCTAKVDGVMYTAYYYADEKIELKDAKGTTLLLLKQSDAQFDNAGISGCKFVDFNRDGYQDLIVRYMTNVPDICDLILYNPKLKRFVKVAGLMLFLHRQSYQMQKYFIPIIEAAARIATGVVMYSSSKASRLLN